MSQKTGPARTTYTYDGAGNVTKADAPAAATFYSWDAHNRMATAQPVAGVVTFAYDGIGRRVTKQVMGSSVQFVWDYEKVLQEADGVGATRTQYLTTDEQYGDLVSSFGAGGSRYFGFDALGSSEALLDDPGSAADRYAYRAYGLATQTSGTDATPYTWVGKLGYRLDGETSLYLLGGDGRHYDPATARFLSRDPAESDANPYRYARNDPVNGVDPSGREEPRNDQSSKARELTSLRILQFQNIQLKPEQEKRLKELQDELQKSGSKVKPIPQAYTAKDDALIGLLPPELRDAVIQYNKNTGLRPQNWKLDPALVLEAKAKLDLEARVKKADEELKKFIIEKVDPKLKKFSGRESFTLKEVREYVDQKIATYYEGKKFAVVSLPQPNGRTWYLFLRSQYGIDDPSGTRTGMEENVPRTPEIPSYYPVGELSSAPDVEVDVAKRVEMYSSYRKGLRDLKPVECLRDTLLLTAKLAPVTNTLLVIGDDKKSEWDVVIAVAEDLSTVVGIGVYAKALRGTRLGWGLVRGAAGVKGAVGLVRIGQGIDKLSDGDDAGGKLYITEGLLHLIFAGADIVLYKKLANDALVAKKALDAAAPATSCFPANTPVTTQDGQKPIQHVRADDLVWGYDLAAREWSLRRVVETYTHDFEGDIVAVAVAGEVIEATGNHPFWVVAGGLDGRDRPEHVPETPPDARTPGRWVDAGSLRIGDMLLLRPDRRAAVTRLTIRQARQTVYNFQVEGVHTYAVGTTQVLVHNKAAANNLLGSALPAKPGRMYVEDYSLLGGREPGREFVVPGRSVPEIFSARLPNGSDTLIVTGTESLGQGTLVNRLRQVQELAGGPGSFNKVTGLASDTLEQLVRSGKFDTQAAAELLGSNLGGKWTVKAVERPGQKGVFDVIAERVGK